jgi:hypothetical protein
LAPGALWLLFQSIGIGKWGFLLATLMDVFHVDVSGMLTSLWNKVKEMIGGGQKTSSAAVDAATESTVQQFNDPATPQEEQQGMTILKQKQNPTENSASDHKVYSSLELLKDARMFRLAIINYEAQTLRLTSEGFDKTAGFFGSTKSKGVSLLGKIFGWIIKLALASAGLMVAGDVANEVLGRPSALSGTYQRGQESQNEGTRSSTPPRATQTKFPFKGDSPLPQSFPLVNNDSNIENMLVQFTKDTYSGLDGKEIFIRNSPAFQAVKDDISFFNVHNPNSAAIFLPKHYRTRRALVDYYIDDVAKSAS